MLFQEIKWRLRFKLHFKLLDNLFTISIKISRLSCSLYLRYIIFDNRLCKIEINLRIRNVHQNKNISAKIQVHNRQNSKGVSVHWIGKSDIKLKEIRPNVIHWWNIFFILTIEGRVHQIPSNSESIRNLWFQQIFIYSSRI